MASQNFAQSKLDFWCWRCGGKVLRFNRLFLKYELKLKSFNKASDSSLPLPYSITHLSPNVLHIKFHFHWISGPHSAFIVSTFVNLKCLLFPLQQTIRFRSSKLKYLKHKRLQITAALFKNVIFCPVCPI